MSSNITEQHFTCPTCNYTAHVAGKRYFELGCNFHIETRECKCCLRLFDNVVTKTATFEAMEAQSNEFSKVYANHTWKNLSDEITAHAEFLGQVKCKEKKNVNCRWCGSDKNEVWSIENPTCPKCKTTMNISDSEYIEDYRYDLYASFSELINSVPKVVLCLVEAECGICRHVRLMLNEIQFEHPNEFCFYEINYNYAIDNNLISKYRLKYFPTLLHFKSGKFVSKFSIVDSKPKLLNKIRSKLSNL